MDKSSKNNGSHLAGYIPTGLGAVLITLTLIFTAVGFLILIRKWPTLVRPDSTTVIVARTANARNAPSSVDSKVIIKLSAGEKLSGRWQESVEPSKERWFEFNRAGRKLYIWEGNLVHAEPSVRSNTMTPAIWRCASISQDLITVTLTEHTYQFHPYNPDGGKLSGSLRPLATVQRRGTEVSEIEFIGSGAPKGRWAFIQTKGKRKALMHYAVETSGDAGECVPPGETNQYVFN